MHSLKPFLALLILITSFHHLKTQPVSYEWGHSFGNTLADYAGSVATDNHGNVYLFGVFRQTVDFDPGPLSYNLGSGPGANLFLVKLDSNGNFKWARNVEGDNFSATGMAVDPSGGIYVTGFFQSIVDFDPGSDTAYLSNTNVGSTDSYVMKMDSAGNFRWVSHYSGYKDIMTFDLTVDPSGNIYTTGRFQDSIYFTSSHNSLSLMATTPFNDDFFVVKHNSNGKLLWAKQGSSPQNDIGYAITVNDSYQVYLLSNFQDTLTFNTSPSPTQFISRGLTDIAISRMDTSGNFLWARQIGGGGLDIGNDITTDRYGNIYTTGFFHDSINLSLGPKTSFHFSEGYSDIYITKMDTNGNMLWASTYGGLGEDFGSVIRCDILGNMYASGSFSNSMYTQTDTLQSVNDLDIFTLKFGANHTEQLALQMSGQRNQHISGMAIDDKINIYGSGSFVGQIDLDPGPGSGVQNGHGQEAFIYKLSTCISLSDTINLQGCSPFLAPDSTQSWTKSGFYTVTLQDSLGCDSLVFIDLMILKVDTSVNRQGIHLYTSVNFATFRWLDCDANYAVIPGATDSIFTPASNGNYAVEINQNGCIDTSGCLSVNGIGTYEYDIKQSISIYPNPTYGQIKIGSVSHPLKEVFIYDLQGQLVRHSSLEDSGILNIEELRVGMYFLKAITADQTFFSRFIKK